MSRYTIKLQALISLFLCLEPIGGEKSSYLHNKPFSSWSFNSHLLHQLPVEDYEGNFVRQVHNCVFSHVRPTPLQKGVQLKLLSRNALESCLDIDFTDARSSKKFLDFANGRLLLNESHAHRYGGHQFGEWAGQLGDGRAHLLGEYFSQQGERWELQLKGSGRTPYSRHGDGRAVLRSSIREFLSSEAMHHLGVPTSRAVSLVVSDDVVKRDPLYNGTVVEEKTAIVLRLAPSWFRFGSLEILSKSGEINLLSTVLDFIMRNHFAASVDVHHPDRYLQLFELVQRETIDMVVKWMKFGFAHGVCNTDNFSLMSITIDYGPFGFLDSYDPLFIPNLSDDGGRYALHRQPSVALFNLRKLFYAISPLLNSTQKSIIKTKLKAFNEEYQTKLVSAFRQKLGLVGDDRGDVMLVASLLHLMNETQADFTMTFRQLGAWRLNEIATAIIPNHLWALADLSKHSLFSSWCSAYYKRILGAEPSLTDQQRSTRLYAVNPRYILRNWMAESAIRMAENGDYSEAWRIHMVLQRPFEEQAPAEYSGYANRPPKWARKLLVSCSS